MGHAPSVSSATLAAMCASASLVFGAAHVIDARPALAVGTTTTTTDPRPSLADRDRRTASRMVDAFDALSRDDAEQAEFADLVGKRVVCLEEHRPSPDYRFLELAIEPGDELELTGRCTAPLLVDARSKAFVSNESGDIVRALVEYSGPKATSAAVFR